jgi:plastocyanin
VLLAACGTPEKHSLDTPLYPVVKAAHVPTSVAVTIEQMKFNPDTVTVQLGDTVVFTNKDLVDHDATALPDSAWTSHALHTGDSWKLVPEKSTDYFCSIHVVMRGYVKVLP